jgi:hypothetical protein
MGRYGSGRPRENATLGQLPRLDVHRMWTRSDQTIIRFWSWTDGSSLQTTERGDRVEVQYSVNGQNINQSVSIIRIPCQRISRY